MDKIEINSGLKNKIMNYLDKKRKKEKKIKQERFDRCLRSWMDSGFKIEYKYQYPIIVKNTPAAVFNVEDFEILYHGAIRDAVMKYHFGDRPYKEVYNDILENPHLYPNVVKIYTE